MKRIIVAVVCLVALTACAAEQPAPKQVEIVSATSPRQEVEFLNTKMLDELKNPVFGGLVVKGTAEWHRAKDGYASTLKLVAQAVDTKGVKFDVNVQVNGEVSDKAVETTKLAAVAAKKFAEDLSAQIAAKSRELTSSK
jgi:hypothetical protein